MSLFGNRSTSLEVPYSRTDRYENVTLLTVMDIYTYTYSFCSILSKRCDYTATGTGLASSATTADASSASTPRYSKYLFHSGSLMSV